jgi:hypothetical protein
MGSKIPAIRLGNMACQNFSQVKTLGKVFTKFCMGDFKNGK